MKKALWIFCILLGCSSAYAQKQQTASGNTPQTTKEEDGFTCTTFEQSPHFPNGNKALLSYIQKHLHYPEAAKKAGIEGRVLVQYYVETDGHLSDFRILKSVHPLLDEEAIRVLKSMPNWIPGTLGGKPTRTRYTMPITFKIK